ncbi:MAG: sulfotransferase, partial [Pseudomonadota bacterium]
MQANYGAIAKLLHRLALNNKNTAALSFEMDQNRVPDNREVIRGGHIFVSGLARSGTTILMRLLHSTGKFASLTYQNMPFVLAPNSFDWLSAGSGKTASLQMRAHDDGILVGFNSPEAFEDVFWRVFDGDRYIKSDHLALHAPPNDTLENFVKYISAILYADVKRSERYLSKNNNNILRLEALAKVFPSSIILIPFRAPIDHARSLLRQHINFSHQQADD